LLLFICSVENKDSLQKSDITNYVDDAIIKKVLSLCLKAVHNSLLNHEDFLRILKRFVRTCLYLHVQHIINGNDKTRYIVDVLDKVKSDDLNEITKNLKVNSLSGLDLANNVCL
jgi:hypothetical protein